jgi:hypothetical protein
MLHNADPVKPTVRSTAIRWHAPNAISGKDGSIAVYPPSPHVTVVHVALPSNAWVPLSCAPATEMPLLPSYIDIPG